MSAEHNERTYSWGAHRLTRLERHDIAVALMLRIEIVSAEADHDPAELYRLRQLLERFTGP